MGIWGWVATNWFNIASLVLGSGLWITAASLHAESKARKISNLFAAIQNHREIWMDYYRRPELWRVLDPSADVEKQPPSFQEAGFVQQVIQHTSGVYRAIRSGLSIHPDGLHKDVGKFFSMPVPRAVWMRARTVQDADFRMFVEDCQREFEDRT